MWDFIYRMWNAIWSALGSQETNIKIPPAAPEIEKDKAMPIQACEQVDPDSNQAFESMEAQGYTPVADKWCKQESLEDIDTLESMQEETFGNVIFKRDELLLWVQQWSAVSEAVNQAICQKEYVKALSLLESIHSELALSSWKLDDEAVLMGYLHTGIYTKNGIIIESGASSINGEFAEYMSDLVICHSQLGHIDKAESAYNLCKNLYINVETEQSDLDKAIIFWQLAMLAKKLNHLDDMRDYLQKSINLFMQYDYGAVGFSSVIYAHGLSEVYGTGLVKIHNENTALNILETFQRALRGFDDPEHATEMKAEFGGFGLDSEEIRRSISRTFRLLQPNTVDPLTSCATTLFNRLESNGDPILAVTPVASSRNTFI